MGRPNQSSRFALPLGIAPDRDDYACTLDEVADALGVSLERAWQIERLALRKVGIALARTGVIDDPRCVRWALKAARQRAY